MAPMGPISHILMTDIECIHMDMKITLFENKEYADCKRDYEADGWLKFEKNEDYRSFILSICDDSSKRLEEILDTVENGSIVIVFNQGPLAAFMYPNYVYQM